MHLKPLDDRVVVEPVDAETTTAGGIVLPDTAKEKPQRGKVKAVGPGRLLDTGSRCQMSISVGDEVLFSKYGGTSKFSARATFWRSSHSRKSKI